MERRTKWIDAVKYASFTLAAFCVALCVPAIMVAALVCSFFYMFWVCSYKIFKR